MPRKRRKRGPHHRDPLRQTRTTTEVGRIFGWPQHAVRQAAREGQFEYIMIGNRMYLLVTSIEKKIGRPLAEIEQQLVAAA